MYEPDVAILLMYESHDMRHTGFRRLMVVAPFSRPDPFGRSEPNSGCSNVTQSPYQNHLSKTRRSVTLQLA